MKVCRKCDSPYAEPISICESDKCSREEAEYERFCQSNGDHCFDCFQEAKINGAPVNLRVVCDHRPDDGHLPCMEVPVCPDCHSNTRVYPMLERHDLVGWICQVCAWMKMAES